MKSVSFRFAAESDVVDFLRWHNQTKKTCFVRYSWNKMCRSVFDSINIVKTNITEKNCVMKIPYVETRVVTAKDLIGETINCCYNEW